MRVSVVGAGYVGLVTAVCLADEGHHVICVDTDEEKVRQISSGKSYLYENGLQELLARCVNGKGTLRASSSYREIEDSEIIFVCVGTPRDSDGTIDLTHVRHAVTDIGMGMTKSNSHPVVVVRSTVPPGTTEEVVIPLLEKSSRKKAGDDFSVAFNPEFLQEGKALQGFTNPDKIVIGQYDQRAGETLEKLFSSFPAPVIRTNIRTAEMIKLASNAFLATKISFINEIGNLCKLLGVDIYQVADAIGRDPRIGRMFLNAGIGFGGSCLPKDLSALISLAKRSGCETEVLDSVLSVNRQQTARMTEIARKILGGFQGKRIAVLGLAFKPNTDDVREAPAIGIIRQLLVEGAEVQTYDPLAVPNARKVLPKEVKFCENARQAVSPSDCVLICTDWDEFSDENLYVGKLVIDGRRVLNPDKAKRVCHYEGVCW